MEVGIVQIMQSFGYENITDAEVYDEEIKLAVHADELGFDHVWTVEHHFEDYSFCPDNFVYLAHIAAKTKRIGLATGACIVPWNLQPLRVAEKAALLDLLSGGRAILGLGRGLSRREFNQFGISMDESRDRFDESAPLILEALETGYFPEHHGKHIHQPKAPIRPRPTKSWKNRVTQVAMSPESGLEAAKLGAQMMAFNYKPADVQRKECADYATAFRFPTDSSGKCTRCCSHVAEGARNPLVNSAVRRIGSVVHVRAMRILSRHHRPKSKIVWQR